ncbi:hypothetical protein LCDV1gp066 [Lymphocystis disease virus 1]|uniref:hypothetical protein n=1 Tax=Fish lymphocystis disease virus TaxID=36363 RepID=UPI0000161F01|nr:hypothetical protein LCDV1gp066 [Lymphocystis disease virus 1]
MATVQSLQSKNFKNKISESSTNIIVIYLYLVKSTLPVNKGNPKQKPQTIFIKMIICFRNGLMINNAEYKNYKNNQSK